MKKKLPYACEDLKIKSLESIMDVATVANLRGNL